MNFWLKWKISYYLMKNYVKKLLRWKITYLILAKHLLFSRNHFFCFQKWKFLGAPTQVFKCCTCVLLNSIDKSMCVKFFIVLQLEDIKQNWKRSDFYMLQESRFYDFALKPQNKTKQKKFLHTFLEPLQTLQREYMLKISEESDNRYLTNRQ